VKRKRKIDCADDDRRSRVVSEVASERPSRQPLQ
jgi:hypothetical protein